MTQRKDGVEPVEAGSTQVEDERVASLEAERDEYLDLLQRKQAEFENYRKRAARDQERLVAHAHERLVRESPVLDDLERAAKPPIRDTTSDRGNRVDVPRLRPARPACSPSTRR